ncbi:MAG: hypothetical protein U0133_04640 [Gemmatimonadales bacterium]
MLVGAERGIEAQLLPTRDFRYHLLPVEPIYRRQWWKNLRWPFVAARLLSRLSTLFDKEQPLAVIGTGGYASGPAVWFGTRRRLPDGTPGAERLPGPRHPAPRPSGPSHLPRPPPRRARGSTRAQHPGLRHRKPDPAPIQAAGQRRWRVSGLSEGGGPILLITGGSQGRSPSTRRWRLWLGTGGSSGITVIWATGRGATSSLPT